MIYNAHVELNDRYKGKRQRERQCVNGNKLYKKKKS